MKQKHNTNSVFRKANPFSTVLIGSSSLCATFSLLIIFIDVDVDY